jgi:hypothetical protein
LYQPIIKHSNEVRVLLPSPELATTHYQRMLISTGISQIKSIGLNCMFAGVALNKDLSFINETEPFWAGHPIS